MKYKEQTYKTKHTTPKELNILRRIELFQSSGLLSTLFLRISYGVIHV